MIELPPAKDELWALTNTLGFDIMVEGREG